MKRSPKRQCVANILMVEDDKEHKDAFCRYLAGRRSPNAAGHGDLKPYVVSFADDLISVCDDVANADEILDVVLLDVRMPKNQKDARAMQPHQFPPRVEEIAEQLQAHPAGKNARIVVFTLYRWVPDVQHALKNIQQRFPNIVRVYSTRPLISKAIAAALKTTWRNAFSLTGTLNQSVEFRVRPTAAVAPNVLASAKIYLNGCPPKDNGSFQDASGPGQHVFFDKSALLARDINYFMIGTGRDKWFRVIK
jgi:CheY-like chemotaxis protein